MHMGHDNTVLRHLVAKIVFLRGSERKGKKILESKISSSNR